MNTLTIKNFGPLVNVSVELNKFNVYVGPQSSGKSCILKVSSFCKWIEKRIELSQRPEEYLNGSVFWSQLIDFHRLNGFVNDDFQIAYKSSYMDFTISGTKEDIHFDFHWNAQNKWQYHRPKIAYIPAERNVVSIIPNWYDIKFGVDNNIQNYMSDWEEFRNTLRDNRHLEILNLGFSYSYDVEQRRERIQIGGDKEIAFVNASSGLQSLIPMYGLIQYITLYEIGRQRSLNVKQEKELDRLQTFLYDEQFSEKAIQKPSGAGPVGFVDNITETFPEPRTRFFADLSEERRFEEIINNYSINRYAAIYLEEPEENLFPSTQYELVKWIAQRLNYTGESTISIATHSPYILSSFNNLIQAADCKDIQLAKTIVGDGVAIRFEDINVYSVDDGCVKDIMDTELRLISQSDLDAASDAISVDFSKLISL